MAQKDHIGVLRYGHLGMTFAILLSGSFFLGHQADQKFGTDPIWTLVGGGFGMVAGFYHLYRAMVRLEQEEAARKAEKREQDGEDRA